MKNNTTYLKNSVTAIFVCISAWLYAGSISSTQNAPTACPTIRDSIAVTKSVLCYGQANGMAVVGVKGGMAPYTFSWTSGSTSDTAINLSAGVDTVTIADFNGCPGGIVIATITQPIPIAITAATFAVTCNGNCNGYATVIPKGGTPPYAYLWSNGQTGATANNLCAATYSLVVNDANGCMHDSNSLNVMQPPQINITKTVSPAYCGQPNGIAAASISGGTPPYTYQWSNGQTTSNINNLVSGIYCFFVTDSNKCIDSMCVNVPNVPGVVASIKATTNVTCNGGSNGAITSDILSGSPPYTYSWAPTFLTTQNASGLSAGVYTLTVTDSNGCANSVSDTITQPALLAVVPSASPANICIGQSSTISATSTGGTAPYFYSWVPGGETGATINVNPAITTTYTVTGTDTNGCPAAPVVVEVEVNSPFTMFITATNDSVTAGMPDILTVVASGNVTYLWSTGQTTSTIIVNPDSTSFYTVASSNSCGFSDTVGIQVIVIPTSVQNIVQSVMSLSCFPNPFTTSTSVLFSTDGKHYLQIADMTGRVIENMECTGKQYELQATNLAKGVYFIKAYNEDKSYMAVTKIVIQ